MKRMTTKAAKKESAPLIYVGAKPEAVAEAKAAILAVIASPAGDAVKIAAIQALTAGLTVNGLTISNCHIQGAV